MAGPFNLGSLFRNTQQVQLAPNNPGPGAPQQQQPQGQPQQLPQGTPGSSMQQQQPQQQGQPQQGTGQPGTSNSPLDPFTDLWKTDPKANPNQGAVDPWSEPLFSTDPAKMREAATKVDFMSQVPQELVQKVMAGNDPAALMQLINSVGQNTLAMSLQIGTATTEHAGKTIGERFNKTLPGRFKDLQIDAQAPTNPALQHPAAQQMLKMARQQVKMMNPDMSPAEVNKQAENYFTAMMSAMSSGESGAGGANEGGASGSGEQDWSSWVQQQAGPNQ